MITANKYQVIIRQAACEAGDLVVDRIDGLVPRLLHARVVVSSIQCVDLLKFVA